MGVKMVDYFSSALVEVLAKLAKPDFGVWSPIQSISAQGIRTGPARSSPFVSKFLLRDNDRKSVTILTKPRFAECHQVREASGRTRKDPDRIDPGWTMSVPL